MKRVSRLTLLQQHRATVIIRLKQLDGRVAVPEAQPLDFSSETPMNVCRDYLAGTVAGAPLSFTKNTRNFAGFVVLAFLETL